MITTAEFKSQIAKPFGREMQKLGFKGTGLNYFKENNDFLFSIHVGSTWGGNCTVGLAIHPKRIDKNGRGKLDLKKLGYPRYEFRMSLSETARGEHWDYSDIETENLQTLDKIIKVIKAKALPVVKLYSQSPTLLDQFEVADLENFHVNYTKRTGTSIATTDIRFAWAMAIFFEFENPIKAKLFAEYGISQLTPDNTFFGRVDLERILR